MPSNIYLLMGSIGIYCPTEMEGIKACLMATKPSEITDIKKFHAQLLSIWNTLASHGTIDEDTVMALDTLAVCLNRAVALAKQNSAYASSLGDLRCAHSPLMDIFHYVCEHHHHSSGAYTNAVAGVLAKLVQLINLVLSQQPEDQRENMLGQLTVHITSMHPNQKSFYVIAEAALKAIKGFAGHLQVSNTRLPNQCLDIMWSGALANSAAKTFCAYYSQLHNPKKDPATYIQSWSVNVEDKLSSPALRKNIIEHLLPHLFKVIPTHFSDWAKKLHLQSMSSSWHVLLLAISKKGVQISPKNDPVLTGLMTSAQLRALLESPDANIRLDAFSLAANAINASKACPEYAFDTIQDLNLLSLMFQEAITPESRSAYSSIFRKALLNMKDFVTTNYKREQRGLCLDDQGAVLKYKCALQSIFQFVISQLIPDSTYAQIVTSIDLIQFFIEHEFDGVSRSSKSKSICSILDIFTPTFTNVMLRFCTNNYDDIRVQASSIINDCPYGVFLSAIDKNVLEQALPILQSFKGRVSDSVAHLITTMFSMYQRHDEKACMALLENIKCNMIGVMESTPLEMHGYFTAWANILAIVDLDDPKKHLFKSLIDLLLTSIVKIWEEIRPRIKLTQSTIAEASDSKYWRVIKESAILLKSIMDFNTQNQWFFFDSTMMPTICQILIDQLTTMTHRGAFAAISAAFVTACSVCFETESLKAYPDTIIAENLDLLASHKQLITRRSAGIPFVFCGVINAAARSDKEKLKKFSNVVFRNLHDIAISEHQQSGNETHDIPQVHALNCIRQLFKDSDLEDGTRQHTNSALKLALTYLNDQTWSVKNSALMLFTALNEKLFGSHKIGDTLPSVNAALFFSRYQGISEILLSLLEQSDSENVNSIVPILAIVSRLKANTENDTILKSFIAILKEKYLCHKVWKIREMSARSVANMVHKTCYNAELFDLLANLGSYSRNKQHGCLLYAMELISQAQETKTELENYTIPAARSFHEACTKFNDGDYIIQRTCLQVLMTKRISNEDVSKICDHLITILSKKQMQPNGAVNLFLETATIAVLENTSEEQLFTLSRMFITSSRYEVQVAASTYFLRHPEQFACLKDLHPYLLNEITSELNHYVRGLFLELALVANVKPTSTLRKPCNMSEKDSLKFDLLALRHQDIPLSSIKLQDPLASIDVKLLKAKIIREVMASGDQECEIDLIMYRYLGLSDESQEVRDYSCFDNTSTIKTKQLLLRRASELGDSIILYVSEQIGRSITQNLADFQSERAGEGDLERVNAFVNEVQQIKELFGLIMNPAAKLQVKASLVSRVETVLQVATKNAATLRCYVYQVHLDTAIRKALVIAEGYKDDERVVELITHFNDLFRDTSYPMF